MKKKSFTLLLIGVLFLVTTLIANTKPSSTVTGTITYSKSTPVIGYTVKVYDKNLQGLTLLGETKTDKKGTYFISYLPKSDYPKDKPDIVIKVFNKKGVKVYESEPYFNALSNLVANIKL